ncbi:1940_t:CDS:2, partial [Scutellospora calospora]
FQSQSNNVSCNGITSKKATKQMTQHTIDKVINQLATPNLDNLLTRGFGQLKHCIHDYLKNIENWSVEDIESETVLIETFEFAYLDNDYGVIIRASSDYYGQVAFSDISVEMDESEQNDYLTDNSLCYAKQVGLKLIPESGFNHYPNLIINPDILIKLNPNSGSSYSSAYISKIKSETRTCPRSL